MKENKIWQSWLFIFVSLWSLASWQLGLSLYPILYLRRKKKLYLFYHGEIRMLPQQTKTANSQSLCKNTETLLGKNNIYIFLHTQHALSATLPIDYSAKAMHI